MQIIDAAQFDDYWKKQSRPDSARIAESNSIDSTVREIIETVRSEGDAAIRRYAERFEKSSPEQLEVPFSMAEAAWKNFCETEKETSAAMELAARHIGTFAELQRKQFTEFEIEMEEGLFTGQKVIPVERAAVYVPAGRFPLFSSVLMGVIPAMAAGVEEIVLASPPMEDGFPDRRILAAAALAARIGKAKFPQTVNDTRFRIFAAGGAQAIAALAIGTESVPRASVIVGPGNKYVAAAKRMLFGEVGIDLVAGPTDVLVIIDENSAEAGGDGKPDSGMPNLAAADMLAQAEHDPDARARALVPSRSMAEKIKTALEKQFKSLSDHYKGSEKESEKTIWTSLDAGGLIIVYQTKEEAIHIANTIAPEHLELHSEDPGSWISSGKIRGLKNYGSLFAGSLAAEVLGDYSAGINHTLPTSGSARYTGGLSVRHFLKTVTTLRCVPGVGFEAARRAAEILGQAEGLAGHVRAAAIRRS
ncbi:MAG: histidinol dehydrogenase [Treponema sp.]|nr:histidinol dehydrogenase [Treponema sp.]